MTAFSQALYYPTIDITDEGWLKNAFLYWDHLQTIVPDSMRKKPYSNKTAREFYERGVLEPLFVESHMAEIDELTNDVLTYIDSAEGTEVLISNGRHRDLHPDKLPGELRKLCRLHPSKVPYEIRHLLEKISFNPKDEWFHVDERFSDFYMTLLATRLSEGRGLGLLTNSPANDRLANAARLDAQFSKLGLEEPRRYFPQRKGRQGHQPRTLAQGALANLVIKGIDIDPTTPVKTILDFKKNHSDDRATQSKDR